MYCSGVSFSLRTRAKSMTMGGFIASFIRAGSAVYGPPLSVTFVKPWSWKPLIPHVFKAFGGASAPVPHRSSKGYSTRGRALVGEGWAAMSAQRRTSGGHAMNNRNLSVI
jgi:hypothetical protein